MNRDTGSYVLLIFKKKFNFFQNIVFSLCMQYFIILSKEIVHMVFLKQGNYFRSFQLPGYAVVFGAENDKLRLLITFFTNFELAFFFPFQVPWRD